MIPLGVVHDVPATWSDQRMHVLDDDGRCWCGPMVEDSEEQRTVIHRPQELAGTVHLVSATP